MWILKHISCFFKHLRVKLFDSALQKFSKTICVFRWNDVIHGWISLGRISFGKIRYSNLVLRWYALFPIACHRRSLHKCTYDSYGICAVSRQQIFCMGWCYWSHCLWKHYIDFSLGHKYLVIVRFVNTICAWFVFGTQFYSHNGTVNKLKFRDQIQRILFIYFDLFTTQNRAIVIKNTPRPLPGDSNLKVSLTQNSFKQIRPPARHQGQAGCICAFMFLHFSKFLLYSDVFHR